MPIGVLLIHGIAGSRREVAPLHEHLAQCGYIVSSPVLAGHEGTPKDLADSTHAEWIGSAQVAADELLQRCDALVVVGFSMGGLIAVNLCQTTDVHKLILINTPVYYWDKRNILRNLAADFPKYIRKYLKAGKRMPVPALLEFRKILRKTKPLFSGVRCPVLIIQTLDDDTVQPRSADFIYSNVEGEKTLKRYETGGHLALYSPNAPDICYTIENMINESG